MPKRKNRMLQVRWIHNTMIDQLFNGIEKRKSIQTEIRKIAWANQQLLQANTATFVFGSKWYPYDNPKPGCNKTLHEKFMFRMDELINGVAHEERAIRAGITTLLGNILSVARHIDDLYNLFPKELLAVMPVIDPKLFNIGTPLIPEEIQEINMTNATNLSVLHKLLINRILLAKVTI